MESAGGVELAALEKRYGATHRGFESLSLRHRYYENHHYNNREKNEARVQPGVSRFLERLRAPFVMGNDYSTAFKP